VGDDDLDLRSVEMRDERLGNTKTLIAPSSGLTRYFILSSPIGGLSSSPALSIVYASPGFGGRGASREAQQEQSRKHPIV
jgi:hypothetical protein